MSNGSTPIMHDIITKINFRCQQDKIRYRQANMDNFNKVSNSNLFATPFSKTRQLSAANTENVSCEIGSRKYYALCGFGGLLSCGITHTMVTPLDLVKCRLQVNAEKYKSLGNGFKVILSNFIKRKKKCGFIGAILC